MLVDVSLYLRHNLNAFSHSGNPQNVFIKRSHDRLEYLGRLAGNG